MRNFTIVAILMSSLMGYLNWAAGSMSQYIFQMEIELFRKLFLDPVSVLHPFIILPLFGQLLLISSFFIRKKGLVVGGILCIGVLYLMILVVGLLASNIKIVISTIPFFIFSAYYLMNRNRFKS